MDLLRPGESLRGKTRASSWNTLEEVIVAYRQARGSLSGGKAVAAAGIDPTLTVLAYRKTTDPDLDILSPVKLRFTDGSDPGPQTPATFDIQFVRTPLVYALTPTTGDEKEAVGVAQAKIAAGMFGPVAVSGVTLCSVNVTDTTHRYATLTNSAVRLASATTGPVRILNKPTGSTGVQQCLIFLNGGGGNVIDVQCVNGELVVTKG